MTTAEELPPPLVKPLRHPIKFVRNDLQRLFYIVLFAHLGEFIIAALYYLLTQKSQTMNNGWHHLVSNGNLRHAIRDVGEGVLGGLLAQAIVYNYFKKGNRRVGKLTTWLKRRFHIPVTPAAILSAIILGALAFTVAYYILNLFHPHDAAPVNSGTLWHRTYENLWATSIPKKVLGLIAALGARRPMRVLFDNTQRWFVERKLDNDRPIRWFYPPAFRARYNYLKDHPDDQVVERTTTQNVIMFIACIGGIALAGYGYYVLTYIA